MANQDVFTLYDKMVDELREIVWWNNGLSKLAPFVTNIDDLFNLLVESDGPYLERVLPPKPHDRTWTPFAEGCGFDQDVTEAVRSFLFRGKEMPLYQHQAEATAFLSSEPTEAEQPRHLIISVPTAGGKTESFFLAMLNHAVRARKLRHHQVGLAQHDLKSLILYPMKALGVDQFNRFIQYLFVVNQRLEAQGMAPIKIGVWDGDTPFKVGGQGDEEDYHGGLVTEGDFARGLRCPVHPDRPLRYQKGRGVSCDHGHSLSWVSATRDIIRSGVDLLITNPEALEHLLIHPANRRILESDDLAFIATDEVHVWRGYDGTSFGLLLQRLLHLYSRANPRVVMASATLRDPAIFAAKLLGQPVHAVTYTPLSLAVMPNAPLSFVDLHETSFIALVEGVLALGDPIGVPVADAACRMLVRLGLAKPCDSGHALTQPGRSLHELIVTIATRADQGAEAIAEDLLDSQLFVRRWTEILLANLPELAALVDLIGEHPFIKYQDLLERVAERGGGTRADGLVTTLLSLGRAAGLIFDKYHFFLKPIGRLYYCKHCQTVHVQPECPTHADELVSELYFCQRCHSPGCLDEKGNLSLLSGESNCGCGRPAQKRRFRSAFLHYNTFTTFLLSLVPLRLSSPKILLFADGRQLIEHLAEAFQDLDYSLVADRLLLYHALLAEEGALREIERSTRSLLFELYVSRTPLRLLRQQAQQFGGAPTAGQDRLDHLYKSFAASLAGMAEVGERLLGPGLLTFPHALAASDPFERAARHLLLRILLVETGRMGRLSGGERVGLTKLKRVWSRFTEYQGLGAHFADPAQRERLLRDAVAAGGFTVADQLEGAHSLGEPHVLFRESARQQLFLTVPATVTYCEDCYEGFPGDGYAVCPHCGGQHLSVGARFDSASRQGSGYLPNHHVSARYPVDHWAKDILGPALDLCRRFPTPDVRTLAQPIPDGIPRVVALSHRAGVPQSIRSAVEDGFKQAIPSVQVVCATPTMELGIDIGHLDALCQVGLPPTKANYLQRTGRAGRRRVQPSLIFTIIRNENAVDGHYLGDLSGRYLNRELPEIPIPVPSTGLLDDHILVETLRYLNFTPGTKYDRYYRLFTAQDQLLLPGKDLKDLFQLLLLRLMQLAKDIAMQYSGLQRHLSTVFARQVPDVDAAIDRLFYGREGALLQAVIRQFEALEQFLGEEPKSAQEAIRAFLSKNSQLGLFLTNLGLFTRFRGAGASVPIFDSTSQELELKGIQHALREGFPGPFADGKAGKGALWRLETRPFEIERVQVGTPALLEHVRLCVDDENCPEPFAPYPPGTESCPLCGGQLETTTVFPYGFGIGRAARKAGGLRRIETTPLMRTFVEE